MNRLGSGNTYKLLLVGDAGTGKTHLVEYHMGVKEVHGYVPTLGVEVHPLRFTTKDESGVCFNVWDCAGDERFAGLGEGYYSEASIALVFAQTEEQFEAWEAKLGTIPSIRCDAIVGSVTRDEAIAPFAKAASLLGHEITYEEE